jgi:hypothetical protein
VDLVYFLLVENTSSDASLRFANFDISEILRTSTLNFVYTELSSWQFVAESRSSEAFVALCLLTVAGTSLLTQKLGFSDTVCPISKC